ncbi:hypothetical protein H4R19_002291 [Coemansia spiralis]|nr:hypothetical protein H4R19_002291 [Coemansia spiralis]
MLSCDNCRRKKIRCNGGKPTCANCRRTTTPCHYSQVGPRKRPRRTATVPAGHARDVPQALQAAMDAAFGPDSNAHGGCDSSEQRRKRRAPSLSYTEGDEMGWSATSSNDDPDAEPSGLGSVSHLMMEQLKESDALGIAQADESHMAGRPAGSSCGHQSPAMEMLRLQTQISSLVDQMRNITIHISGVASPQPTSPPTQPDTAAEHKPPSTDTPWSDKSPRGQGAAPETRMPPPVSTPGGGWAQSSPANPLAGAGPQDACAQPQPQLQPAQGPDVSRDLINHLIDVYFEYSHPAETGMYPMEMYKERLRRAQVSEPFLLSTLAVASRLSDDPRVKREPAYLAGYDFFERVTRGRVMEVLERDCVENMLTLNNLAIFAVGLPVANRGWYFSGLAMRMATQMSLQKVDAPGRMPGASMMSSSGLESARRAFWTTLLLEALASFASGEPPPITIQDIHVAAPFDDPTILGDDTSGLDLLGSVSDSRPSVAGPGRARERPGRAGAPPPPALPSGKGVLPNVCARIAQLSMLLIRVARLNGNRHPESALFSPEYAALHSEMIAWYQGLPDSMQIKVSTAKDEIAHDPRLFAAKMFVHCHYQAAIIALHQPRVDLVRLESAGSAADAGGPGSSTSADQQWRHLARQQCLTAACTMTELLALARPLDVRYCIVTFGFAVFMAGVVHVGAVACTPRGSNERQYSINCVKEHVRCLDHLGKYFAFHFIMAKHIRAQLQAIEAADLLRQKAATLPRTPMPPSQRSAFDPTADFLGMGAHAMPLGISAALGMPHASSPFQLRTAAGMPMAGLDIAGAGAFNTCILGSGMAKQRDMWLDSAAAALASSAAFTAAPNNEASTSSPAPVDLLLGLFGTSSPVPTAVQDGVRPAAAAQCPGRAVCAGLCGTHSPSTTAAMVAELQGLSGMAGLGSGLGSLVDLFAPSGDCGASLYPQCMLDNSSLAPPPKAASDKSTTATLVDPAAPLRLTAPGGVQRFGSLPPYAPL